MVFQSVNEISNAKNIEDKYQIEIHNLNVYNKKLVDEKVDLEQMM